jgi:hypothetical protein
VQIVGKERPDLETPAARAQHAVSLKPLLALDSKGCPLRLSNPTAEKARTGSQVKQTAWFCAAALALMTYVAVGELNPDFLYNGGKIARCRKRQL